MQRVSTILRRFITWLRNGRPLWVWIAIVAVVVVIPQASVALIGYPLASVDGIRWSGLFLQIAGLATIVHDLDSAVKRFGGVSVWEPVVSYWSELVTIIRGGRSIAVGVGTAKMRMRANAVGVAIRSTAGGTVEERLKRLEARMEQQEKDTSGIHRKIDEHVEAINNRFDEERNEREAAEKRIAEQVREAVVGKIHLKLGGVAYLLIGIVLSSVPLR